MVQPAVLDPFIYFVSGVLKLWHLLLQDVMGLNDSVAWVVSLAGLVITVRSLIAPFSWMQARSGRTSVSMRPDLAALKEEYASRTDKESVAEFEAKRKEIHKRYNYRPAAGCVPILIQVPVFLGLYRTVLSMSRPPESLEVPPDTTIGFLNAAEINAFISADVAGIPLPASLSMPAEMFDNLGTTREDVFTFILPILILAVIFTMANLGASIYRNVDTLDWDSGMARGTQRFLIIMTVLIPFLLIGLALYGPIPVAIILYWFANNLWTLGQSIIIRLLVEKKYPLAEEYKAHHNERREAVKGTLQEKRAYKWDVRRRKALGAVQPWKIPSIHRELSEEVAQRKSEETEEKARKKAIEKAKRASRIAINKEKRESSRARRREKKENSKSNNPPAEPITSDEPDPEQSPTD